MNTRAKHSPETKKTGLKALEGIDDISIIAAPGSSYGYDNVYQSDAQTIIGLLISHAENMRYRIAVIDSGNEQAIADVRALRARYIRNTRRSITRGFVFSIRLRSARSTFRRAVSSPGIYARNDINRAVYKAPANEWSTSLSASSSCLTRASTTS